MIPKITVFVSSPPTKEENDIVKRFLEMKFAPLVDANHKNSHQWFLNNVKPTPHKLFSFERQNVYFYEVDDLHSNMDFTPNVLIHWNEGDIITEEQWRSIREWLVYKFYTCYDFLDYMKDEIAVADLLMKRPVIDVVLLPEKENESVEKNESYSFQTHFLEDKNTMLYEIKKPHTDLPYTSVIRNFSKRGHLAFFPSLYICQSWGVSRHDLTFLSFVWKHLGFKEEDFNMDLMLKEATENCYPSENGPPESEPEVYRRCISDVLTTLQFQQDGISCGHNFTRIPQSIKDRF